MDLLLSIPVPLTFRLLTDHGQQYFDGLKYLLSWDGTEWVSCISIHIEVELFILEGYEGGGVARFKSSFTNSTYRKSQIDPDPLPRSSCRTLPPNDYYHDHLLDCTFAITETGYRFIRLYSEQELDFPFGVYDFSFHGRVAKGYEEDDEGRLARGRLVAGRRRFDEDGGLSGG